MDLMLKVSNFASLLICKIYHTNYLQKMPEVSVGHIFPMEVIKKDPIFKKKHHFNKCHIYFSNGRKIPPANRKTHFLSGFHHHSSHVRQAPAN
jgi:hypothetical protein